MEVILDMGRTVAEQGAQFKKDRAACKMRPREDKWEKTPTMASLRLGTTADARHVHVLRHGLYEREKFAAALREEHPDSIRYQRRTPRSLLKAR